jgi:hypothetical protein
MLAVLVVCAACGSDPEPPEPDPTPDPRATVDELAGTYRGVGIGSTRDEAELVLGRLETGPNDPLAPIGGDPVDLGFPPAPQDPRPSPGIAIWRFDDVAMAAGRGRAWLVAVAAQDAFTRAGVGVGSDLDDVRAAYPAADCDTANEGTEYTPFDYCTLRVAPGRYLWFGNDPVRSLTMSREPLR